MTKFTNNDLDQHVGQKIHERRVKTGLSLAELGEKVGISHQQIQKYECGLSRVSASCLFQLAKVLGVSSEYFFSGYNEKIQVMQSFDDVETINTSSEKSLNILVVEDSPSDELLLRKALENTKNVSLFCVHDGSQMLEFLRSKRYSNFPRPDLILLDLNIPKRNGLDALREVKRDRILQDIPVVIISNNIHFKELMQSYRNFAAGYLCKHFSFEDFTDSIHGLVNYWMNVVYLPRNCL